MPTRPSSIEPLENRRLLSAVLAAVGTQPVGPLTGKIVYASGGHGLTDNGSGVWVTGRGVNNGMIEDMGNVDQMSLYADAAWRAGATVVPMRPVGHQMSEVTVDNLNAVYTGTWADSTQTPYYSTNNGSGVHFRTAVGSTTETATASFTPNLPKTDFYPVYAWADSGSDRAPDQVYRVNHTGGSTEVKVNHQLVGKGWVYLGTYRFTAGTSGSVVVSNRTSAGSSKVVVADAIRFGNGMGDQAPHGETSGQSREDEASLYWVAASAGWTAAGTRVPSSNWRSLTLDSDANVGAPLRWAKYMNEAPLGQSLYLSFHSNASGGTGTQSPRGGEGLYNDSSLFPGTNTPNQQALATIMGEELRTDMTSLTTLPTPWFNNVGQDTYARTDYAFGEIRGDTSGNEFDATILEVAFHDNSLDASILKDPVGRERIAQAAVRGTVNYFNQFGGGTLAYAPDAPSDVRTSVDPAGNVTVRWDAPTSEGNFNAAPTGYRVYASRDGYGFDGGTLVAGNVFHSLTIPAAQAGAGTDYFRVVAVNAGGESLPSAVVAVRAGDPHVGRVLIVDGFDRLQESQDPIQLIANNGTNSDGPLSTLNSIERVRPRWSNSFDYAVQHAQAIADSPANLGVDTADNAAIINGSVNLSSYAAVVWISGEESTTDHTFNATEQAKVTAYLNGGGKLLVSGSEIGWDLQAKGNGVGFFNDVLHADYVTDDANTYAASGVAASIFAGIALAFDNGSTTYDVDFPDRLSPGVDGTTLLNYVGGTGGAAAVAWASETSGTKTIVMGFPFETITDAAQRAKLMRAALDWFGLSASTIATTTGGGTSPLDGGLTLTPGVTPPSPAPASTIDPLTPTPTRRRPVALSVIGIERAVLA